MIETLKKEWQAQVPLVFFIILTIFWASLQLGVFSGHTIFNHSYQKFFGAIYGVMALWGAIWGLIISQKWGGSKSLVGKALAMFSLGLLLQEFGQLALSYIDYVLGISGAYPSIGDIGYFGSIPLYILGVLFLAQASGVRVEMKTLKSLALAVIIPLSMLVGAYLLFLQGYQFDWKDPIKVFLDFGYPFGQAIYISLAILTFLLTKNVLGGVMKTRVLWFLAALVIQFASDYTFLFQSSRGTWKVGEINDFMYLVAYFVMTLSLLQLQTVLSKLKGTN